MRKKALSIFLFSALLGLAISFPIVASAALNVQEGEWETTIEMQMEGMPFAIPPVTAKQCVTKEDAVPKGGGDDKCKTKDQKITGNKITWTTECKDRDSKSVMKGEITYSGKSYKGTMKTTTTDRKGGTTVSNAALSGRRIGPCTDKSKSQVLVGGQDTTAMYEQAKKEHDEAQAEQKAEDDRNEAVFNKFIVPEEDAKSCSMGEDGSKESRECEKLGKLNLKPGSWEITRQVAKKERMGDLAPHFKVEEEHTETQCLTSESPLPRAIKGESEKKANRKRSTKKIFWKLHDDDYQSYYVLDEKGGLNYKGDTLDGAISRTETSKTGAKIETVTRTKITAHYTEDGACLGRDYTSQDRDYTSKKRKKAAGNAAGDAVNKLKGLFGR